MQFNRSSYTWTPEACDVPDEYSYRSNLEEGNKVIIRASPKARFHNIKEHRIPFVANFQVQIEDILILEIYNSKERMCSGKYIMSIILQFFFVCVKSFISLYLINHNYSCQKNAYWQNGQHIIWNIF